MGFVDRYSCIHIYGKRWDGGPLIETYAYTYIYLPGREGAAAGPEGALALRGVLAGGHELPDLLFCFVFLLVSGEDVILWTVRMGGCWYVVDAPTDDQRPLPLYIHI